MKQDFIVGRERDARGHAVSVVLSSLLAMAAAGLIVMIPSVSRAAQGKAWSSAADPGGYMNVVGYSIAGNVYDPKRWRPLELSTFFSDGWDEAWASGPNGEGGAPRQGWLNSADGVFYRLFLFTGGWAHQDNHDTYNGGFTIYTAINRRFELRWDVPYAVNNVQPGGERTTSFGDLQIAPRFLLSESQDFTQSFDVTVRIPTGAERTGSSMGAVSPLYNFWWNAVGGFVLRGGVGANLPYRGSTRESFIANLSAGYYFTQHDAIPFGDLVWYVATNLNQLTDGEVAGTQVPNHTTVTFTPGFRTHLGDNFYLLGGVEIPATNPKAFDYQVLGALMKVW